MRGNDNGYTEDFNTPSFWRNSSYFEVLNSRFTSNFGSNLVDFILEFPIEEYCKSILGAMVSSINLLTSSNLQLLTPIAKAKKVHCIINFDGSKKFSIKDFKQVLFNTPALIPLGLMLVKMRIYLDYIQSQPLFIDSISIKFDKKELLLELWDKNLCCGMCSEKDINKVFPIINEHWGLFPKIQQKYRLLAFLYIAIEKSIFKPVEKIEDRLIHDIQALLDVYCFSQDDVNEFSFSCGPAMIPSVQDKISSILYVNIVKPEKREKEKSLSKQYIQAYLDYQNYKNWFKLLKFLAKSQEKCVHKINYDIQYSNLEADALRVYQEAVNKIFSCPIKNKNTSCQYLCKKTCKNPTYTLKRDINNYLYQVNERFYRSLYKDLGLTTNEEILNFVQKEKLKPACIKLISSKYPIFRNVSVKTISNIFSQYSKIIEKHAKLERDEEIQDDTRNYNYDDKEFRTETSIYEKIPEKLERIYYLYWKFLINPNEDIYDEMLDIVKGYKNNSYLKKNRIYPLISEL